MKMASNRKDELIAGSYTDLLTYHAEVLSGIYSVFASVIEDANEFWDTMSKEKLDHKTVIAAVDEKYEDGAWEYARPDFIASAIVESCEHIAEKKNDVEQSGISMKDAIQYALDAEHSLIEMEFFRVEDADSSLMMNTLQSLTAYTRAHVKRLELEAKRFKWKLHGRKLHTLKPSDRATTTARLQENLQAAQAEIIGSLVSLEEAVAQLYTAYSERLPDHASFWLHFAAEEMQHAAMLRKLYDVLEGGHVFFNVARFKPEEVREQIDDLQNMQFDAKHGELSLYSAVNYALATERMLAENSFYSIVESDAPEYKYIAERMIHFSKEHVRELEEEAGKAIDMGVLAKNPEKPPQS